MTTYNVKIDPDAIVDIQEIKKWYNDIQGGLGNKFRNIVMEQIKSLKNDPQIYAIRYKEIRCMIVKQFPYMVHFYINEDNKLVEVLAVISTDRNPDIWNRKTKR
jgi:mRNA-degrading endonuclease RelE of RelBE toxin-antitoxin system